MLLLPGSSLLLTRLPTLWLHFRVLNRDSALLDVAQKISSASSEKYKPASKEELSFLSGVAYIPSPYRHPPPPAPPPLVPPPIMAQLHNYAFNPPFERLSKSQGFLQIKEGRTEKVVGNGKKRSHAANKSDTMRSKLKTSRFQKYLNHKRAQLMKDWTIHLL